MLQHWDDHLPAHIKVFFTQDSSTDASAPAPNLLNLIVLRAFVGKRLAAFQSIQLQYLTDDSLECKRAVKSLEVFTNCFVQSAAPPIFQILWTVLIHCDPGKTDSTSDLTADLKSLTWDEGCFQQSSDDLNTPGLMGSQCPSGYLGQESNVLSKASDIATGLLASPHTDTQTYDLDVQVENRLKSSMDVDESLSGGRAVLPLEILSNDKGELDLEIGSLTASAIANMDLFSQPLCGQLDAMPGYLGDWDDMGM